MEEVRVGRRGTKREIKGRKRRQKKKSTRKDGEKTYGAQRLKMPKENVPKLKLKIDLL